MNRIAEMAIQSIIAGLIALSVVRFVSTLHTTTYERTASVIMESNLMTVANVMSDDFKHIGRHAGSMPIIEARADSIAFLGDKNNDGAAEMFSYNLSVISQDSGIYRQAQGESPIRMDVKLSTLRFTYFDAAGDTTSNTADIKSVNVMVKINNPDIKTTATPMLFWTRTFYFN